mmetsp:Transcript_16480/g.28852  ORF Transcript_16480/g.28852 Transcript_16480/m.28852 type:complete len:132 (+) Transcript_16480:60-455(+)
MWRAAVSIGRPASGTVSQRLLVPAWRPICSAPEPSSSSAGESQWRHHKGCTRPADDEAFLKPAEPIMAADSRVALIGGALLCFGGSLLSVYVAVTHDPNKKEDRWYLKRGEFLSGASVVGALTMMYLVMRR